MCSWGHWGWSMGFWLTLPSMRECPTYTMTSGCCPQFSVSNHHLHGLLRSQHVLMSISHELAYLIFAIVLPYWYTASPIIWMGKVVHVPIRQLIPSGPGFGWFLCPEIPTNFLGWCWISVFFKAAWVILMCIWGWEPPGAWWLSSYS